MSVDFTEVLERTVAPPMGIDPYAALHGAQRRRRRRRLTAVGATLAVVASAGLAATVDGGRGTPMPAATTLTQDMVTAPLDKELWSFDLTPSRQVQFGRVVQGTNRVIPVGSAPVVNGQAWIVPKGRSDVVLGVAPVDGAHSEDIFLGGFLGSGSGSDGETLDPGLEVYVRQFDDPTAASLFRGRVFTDTQGRLRGPGGLLPTAVFGPDSAPVTLWVDVRTQVYGRTSLHSMAMGRALTTGVVADRDAMFQSTSSGAVTSPGATTVVGRGQLGTEEGWVSGIGPKGITNLRVEFSAGTTVVTPLETKPLGNEHVAFAAEYQGTKGRTVTIILRWTNPDGSQGSRDV
jgi:hypothetical protein